MMTCKTLAIENTTAALKVELFPRGHYFIGDERLSLTNYRLKLNELLFGIDDNVPTFRQLIISFVRASVGGDDNSFLRTLTRASYSTYRSVYDFLFLGSRPAAPLSITTRPRKPYRSTNLSKYSFSVTLPLVTIRYRLPRDRFFVDRPRGSRPAIIPPLPLVRRPLL